MKPSQSSGGFFINKTNVSYLIKGLVYGSIFVLLKTAFAFKNFEKNSAVRKN